MQGLNEVSKYFNEELQCISQQTPSQDQNLYKIYSVLVKANYQITFSGVTKRQNTLCHMRKTTRGTEKQHFSEHVSPFHGPQLVL